MRKALTLGAVGLLALARPGLTQEAKTSTHVLLPAAELKWGEPPPALPKGATFVVVSGDPGQPVPFAVRLKMPAGYKISAHWHPTDEHVTVLSGIFALGMGEAFDQKALKNMSAGGYGLMPAEMRHFAMAKTAATIQVHGIGPFVLNYVNPADDPRTAAPAK